MSLIYPEAFKGYTPTKPAIRVHHTEDIKNRISAKTGKAGRKGTILLRKKQKNKHNNKRSYRPAGFSDYSCPSPTFFNTQVASRSFSSKNPNDATALESLDGVFKWIRPMTPGLVFGRPQGVVPGRWKSGSPMGRDTE